MCKLHFLSFDAGDTHTHWHNLPRRSECGCCICTLLTTLENAQPKPVTAKKLAAILCVGKSAAPRIQWWIMFPWKMAIVLGYRSSPSPFSDAAIFVKLVKFQRLPPSQILRHPLKSQRRKAAKCGNVSDTDPAQPSVGTNLVHHSAWWRPMQSK